MDENIDEERLKKIDKNREDILRHISRKIDIKDFRKFGRFLTPSLIDNALIDRIYINNIAFGIEETIYKMLEAWTQQQKQTRNVEDIANALENIEHKLLATQIRKIAADNDEKLIIYVNNIEHDHQNEERPSTSTSRNSNANTSGDISSNENNPSPDDSGEVNPPSINPPSDIPEEVPHSLKRIIEGGLIFFLVTTAVYFLIGPMQGKEVLLGAAEKLSEHISYRWLGYLLITFLFGTIFYRHHF